eukprot:PhF_6_TR32135/c0_g1_i1/m.47581
MGCIETKQSLTHLETNNSSKARQQPLDGRHCRILFVGINYTSSSFGPPPPEEEELRGCVDDVWNTLDALQSISPHALQDMMFLVESSGHSGRDNIRNPTRDNILCGLRWLMADDSNNPNHPITNRILQFSGHGVYLPDQNTYAIAPADYQHRGYITCHEIAACLSSSSSSSSPHLFSVIADCCYSGVIFRQIVNMYRQSPIRSASSNGSVVILLASCTDEERSAETTSGVSMSKSGGIFTSALCTILQEGTPSVMSSYEAFFAELRRRTIKHKRKMCTKHSQEPYLVTSSPDVTAKGRGVFQTHPIHRSTYHYAIGPYSQQQPLHQFQLRMTAPTIPIRSTL